MLIQLDHVKKEYGDFTLELDMQIPENRVIGLIGANGAGKSTTFKLMLGLIRPDAGDVKVFEKKEGELSAEDRQKIGTVFSDSGFSEYLTVQQVGRIMQEFYSDFEPEQFYRRCEYFHIPQKKKIKEFSTGMKAKLKILLAVSHDSRLLILDEPTSQLDPIAASDFLATVRKINRDIGTTVIITEHRLQDIIPYADKVFVMDKGSVFLEGTPREVGQKLKSQDRGIYLSMPEPVQIYGEIDSDFPCPLTVSEGRIWMKNYIETEKAKMPEKTEHTEKAESSERAATPAKMSETAGTSSKIRKSTGKDSCAIELRDVWFRYEKDSPDVVRDLSLKVRCGEFYALVGGNGTGKSTTLSLLSRVRQPYRGRIYFDGRDIRSFKDRELYNGYLGVLPQNPQSIFLKKTVLEDLYSVIGGRKNKKSAEYPIDMKKENAIEGIVSLTKLEELLERHPYDLSGGEQQRLALAKVLLLRPKILLMDEPTKGMDAEYKAELGKILKKLQQHGMTIFMISHDVEFVAEYADRVGLFFEGSIITSKETRAFFAGNNFYTTAANRMARQFFPDAVTGKDVVSCLKKLS